ITLYFFLQDTFQYNPSSFHLALSGQLFYQRQFIKLIGGDIYFLICLFTSAFVSPSTTTISTNTFSIILESLPSAFFLGTFLYLITICSSLGIPSGNKSSKLLKLKTFFNSPI